MARRGSRAAVYIAGSFRDMFNEVIVRVARVDEIPALAGIVERSFRGLGKGHYAPGQIGAALGPAIRVDSGLVEDGTYFAAELGGEVVGCGGWSAKIPTAAGAPLPTPR